MCVLVGYLALAPPHSHAFISNMHMIALVCIWARFPSTRRHGLSLYITGKPLIRLLGVDRLNQQMDVQRDGVFDFVEGVTVRASNGRVIFPCLKSFNEGFPVS